MENFTFWEDRICSVKLHIVKDMGFFTFTEHVGLQRVLISEETPVKTLKHNLKEVLKWSLE